MTKVQRIRIHKGASGCPQERRAGVARVVSLFVGDLQDDLGYSQEQQEARGLVPRDCKRGVQLLHGEQAPARIQAFVRDVALPLSEHCEAVRKSCWLSVI